MKYIVVKLSGGMVSPAKDLINQTIVRGYVNEIKSFYTDEAGGESTNERPRLVLVIGGGGVSRMYRDLAKACGEDDDSGLHRIGMTATWLNAELMRSLLGDIAHPRVLGVGVYAENQQDAETLTAKEFENWLSGTKPVLVSGGFIKGASTDFNSMLIASKIGVDTMYKLTDVDHVYTKDPKEHPEATPIDDMSWDEFARMFGEGFEMFGHKPGAHVPLDMFAAKLAKENGLRCVLADGRNPEVMAEVLRQKEIPGTVMHP